MQRHPNELPVKFRRTHVKRFNADSGMFLDVQPNIDMGTIPFGQNIRDLRSHMGPKGRKMGYDKELRLYRAQNDRIPPQHLGHVSPVGSPRAKLTGTKRHLPNYNHVQKIPFWENILTLNIQKLIRGGGEGGENSTLGLKFVPAKSGTLTQYKTTYF